MCNIYYTLPLKSSVRVCLFFPVGRDFFLNFRGWLATLLAPLNLPLSNDLIRYSWGLGDTVKLQLIQGRAYVEVHKVKPQEARQILQFSGIRKGPENQS